MVSWATEAFNTFAVGTHKWPEVIVILRLKSKLEKDISYIVEFIDLRYVLLLCFCKKHSIRYITTTAY